MGQVPTLGQSPWETDMNTACCDEHQGRGSPEREGASGWAWGSGDVLDMVPGLWLIAAGGGQIHRDPVWSTSQPDSPRFVTWPRSKVEAVRPDDV